jgi:erythrocyte band 7 integral membrane protein
LQNLLSKR